jgi:hypothetical protein
VLLFGLPQEQSGTRFSAECQRINLAHSQPTNLAPEKDENFG